MDRHHDKRDGTRAGGRGAQAFATSAAVDSEPVTVEDIKAAVELFRAVEVPKPTNFEEAVAAGWDLVEVCGGTYAIDFESLKPDLGLPPDSTFAADRLRDSFIGMGDALPESFRCSPEAMPERPVKWLDDAGFVRRLGPV